MAHLVLALRSATSSARDSLDERRLSLLLSGGRVLELELDFLSDFVGDRDCDRGLLERERLGLPLAFLGGDAVAAPGDACRGPRLASGGKRPSSAWRWFGALVGRDESFLRETPSRRTNVYFFCFCLKRLGLPTRAVCL